VDALSCIVMSALTSLYVKIRNMFDGICVRGNLNEVLSCLVQDMGILVQIIGKHQSDLIIERRDIDVLQDKLHGIVQYPRLSSSHT
jgi:adenylate cyclase